MKEDREFIDDLFRNHLESQTFDVPSEFISDIVNRIEEKKKSKKRRLIIIFFIGCFLFLLGLVFLIPFSKENENERLTNKKEVKRIVKQKNETKNSLTEKKINSFELENSILVKTSVSKILSNDNSSLNKSKINHHKIRKKTANKSKEKLKNKTNLTIQTMPIQDEKIDRDYAFAENVTKEDFSSENSSDSSSILNSKQNDSTGVASNQNNSEKSDLCSSFNKSNASDRKFREIQIYSGYQINIMDKNSKTNASDNNIQNNFASNYSFGINAQLAYKKLVFGSGFELTQWKENYSWDQQNLYLQDSVLINMSIPIPYATDTTGLNFYDIKVNDVIYYYQTQSMQYKLSNTLNIFQLPFYFGYKLKLQKFELIPKVGINVGLIRGNNFVQLPQYNANSISSTSVPNSPFIPFERNHFLASYQIGVDFRKQFENWFIYANPYYRNGISSLIQNDRKPLIQYGCNFGLGFIF
jgi:hypothetical protein